MDSIYHAGELAVQARAGAQEMAQRVGKGIKPTLPPVAQAFLSAQPMVLVGSSDWQGRMWASLLAGTPGFMAAIDEQTIRVTATPSPGDPLRENLRDQVDIGLLAIDLASRRRMRVNGRVDLLPGGFALHARQVYSNCQKYIQSRQLEMICTEPGGAGHIRRSDGLRLEQQEWMSRADTFFIASGHPEAGADISHRGGHPGFVRVINARTLIFPDYAGNTMFQTLGNLHANPHAGLLLIDFARGATLQLTGTARIIWNESQFGAEANAERLVEIEVTETIEIENASPFRSYAVEYSPFNPQQM
jgi:predicted pyridoxine 5'-phosphate oxidase superfamily flavin-nucleotide-binding protein